MSTNYYIRFNPCPQCHRGDELHLGKSSMGWRFVFRVYSASGPSNIDEWKPLIVDPHNEIYDEYGRKVEKDEFWRMVLEKAALQGNEGPYWKREPEGDTCNQDFC